jgi:hypothetical protein
LKSLCTGTSGVYLISPLVSLLGQDAGLQELVAMQGSRAVCVYRRDSGLVQGWWFWREGELRGGLDRQPCGGGVYQVSLHIERRRYIYPPRYIHPSATTPPRHTPRAQAYRTRPSQTSQYQPVLAPALESVSLSHHCASPCAANEANTSDRPQLRELRLLPPQLPRLISAQR